jgi:SAM-dependent methyltransferase
VKNLYDLRPGEVAEVPIDDKVFDFCWSYIHKQERFPFWHKSIWRIMENFSPLKFESMYFCLKCRRFEDGTHRLAVARMRGMKTILVKAFAGCHQRIKASPGMNIREAPVASNKKDAAWTAACRDKKWIHLRGAVNYAGRKVLDVGSQSGYTCFESIKEGAASALGIEIRADMVRASNDAAATAGLSGRVKFQEGDWLTIEAPGSFGVVHCMGLLHYFHPKDYGRAVAKLAVASADTLVLEMRLTAGAGNAIKQIGSQTLPTTEWLSEALAGLGFVVRKKFPVVGAIRELWICGRTP